MKAIGSVLLVVAALILISVGYLGITSSSLQKKVGEPAAAPAASTAAGRAAIMAVVETSTPGPTGTSTPDLVATAEIERDAAIAAADVARRAELDAQQISVYAQQTADGAQIAALNATMTLGAQTIQLASIHATDNSVSATRQAAAITDRNNAGTVTALAPQQLLAAKKTEAEAETAKMRAYVQPVASLILSIAALGMTIVFAVAIAGRQPAQVVEVETASGPGVTHIDKRYVTEVIDAPFCTAEQWQSWSTWMLAGGSASVAEWETSISPFRGTEYRLGLYKWAVKNKMIAIVDRVQVLTDRGREYVTAHSPAVDLAQ